MDWLRQQRRKIGRLRVRFGRRLLRRTKPVNADDYGESRGQCIDRYYIEQFLAAHTSDIKGHVLEFGDDLYARRFGKNIASTDVLHRTAGNQRATIVGDLASGEDIPSDTYDCIICTQVLHCIYEVEAAVRTLHRALKPGGVVLVTDAGIQKIDSVDIENGEEYWRFTSFGLRRLFENVFPLNAIQVQARGNTIAAIAFLHGLAVEDLPSGRLDIVDADYELSIALRAVKPGRSA